MDSTQKLYHVLNDIVCRARPSDAALRTALSAASAYPDHGRYASLLVAAIVDKLETLLFKPPVNTEALLNDIYHTARLLLNYVSRLS